MTVVFNALIYSMLVMIISSCGGFHAQPSPLKEINLVSRYENQASSSPDKKQSTSLPLGTISISQAVTASLEHHPTLRTFAFKVEAMEAGARQEGLLSNPELALEMEEFLGTGGHAGLDAAVSTLSIEQSFPLFGRLSKGRRAAAYDVDAEGLELEIKKLEMITRTTVSYIDLVASSQKENVAVSNLKLMEELRDAVAARVTSGKVAPLELARAEVQAGLASSRVMDAKRESVIARSHLASMWGQVDGDFTTQMDALPPAYDIPPMDQVELRAHDSPRLLRKSYDLEALRAHLVWEKSKAVPDFSVGVGLQRYNENDEFGTVASAAVELPLFDRNQGGIAESKAKISQAKSEIEEAIVEMHIRVREAYLKLESARQNSKLIDEEVVPKAQYVAHLMDDAYRLGEIGLLEFIDAQMILLGASVEQIEVRSAFHKAISELEGLLGISIPKSGKYFQ